LSAPLKGKDDGREGRAREEPAYDEELLVGWLAM